MEHRDRSWGELRSLWTSMRQPGLTLSGRSRSPAAASQHDCYFLLLPIVLAKSWPKYATSEGQVKELSHFSAFYHKTDAARKAPDDEEPTFERQTCLEGAEWNSADPTAGFEVGHCKKSTSLKSRRNVLNDSIIAVTPFCDWNNLIGFEDLLTW